MIARHTLRVDLEQALARRDLAVFDQPIVRLDDGRVVGAEALAR